MATKSKARRTKDQVVDVTEKGAAGAAAATQEAADQATGEVRGEVRGKLLREAPYAARGLGKTVAEATREVEAEALPERLRRTPGAVASKVSRLGTDTKSTYVALAARGRGEQVRDAGKSAATAATDTASAALGGSDEASDGTGAKAKELGGKVVDSVKHASEVAGTKATEVVGKVKRVATRSSAGGDEAEQSNADEAGGSDTTGTASTARGKAKDAAGRVKGAATRTATSARGRTKAAAKKTGEQAEKLDVGTGPLEKRTVAQLRNRASELGIEGRTTMNKKDLAQAIRDAT
ncbi:Rho termination factor N-terminal domain-containing protein [Nitriliruptor alkaliphilus]|uniref:Rho termination factor N-terminal domain-containing protein n=1 Tax=Nitriliruptor alkaliphilus TaxID=427918 RepID=UPI0006982E25|nr:Rho termination factor N-terminal domain-containing protein [Nitriliruptor alkaliphilus]